MRDGPGAGSGGPVGGRLVRLFTLTGGRTQPTRDVFTLITLVTAVEQSAHPVGRALQAEHLRILRLCPRPVAVVELAAQLDLPVSVLTIMLCDLLEVGLITARPPVQAAAASNGSPGIALLQRVRDGLARL
ncbi:MULTISPECIES: DUF742 domain-containing protein [Streptomyces]|uniref:DUF742 domain-containing protein n=1 Tax=Streptomyces dengpaensis TaxID=2049881 RepID=A0ABN5I4R8_9ACTN|nr:MULTISPECIES: DUF742 domain-containing protein [Streptomyces]AVH58017.1 DUF742 domain-containing protein [Streptomyces dengpaensis]PIB06490.1 hypothetical protein B1C81_24090 [Streptomyces sp. HG99]